MVEDPLTQIDYDAGADPETRGQECNACFRLFTWESGMFNRNSAYKTGYYPQCTECQKKPKMTIAEHTARLREMNHSSEGTKRQRHEDQSEFRKDRSGRRMDASLFLQKLLHLVPGLYVAPGGIVGDLGLYVTGLARPEWEGNTFKYVGYVTLGIMPEYSTYDFDNQRDVMIRVKDMGWRSMLLRFVENGIVTEKQCDQEFGTPSGGTTSTWYKALHKKRNQKVN